MILQEKAGRPMGPSTLRCEYLWEVVVVYVGLLFWFYSFLSVFCEAVVISQGSVFVFGPLSPSRPDPCLFFNCLSSSFFSLFGTFVDAVSLSLSLSLSFSLSLPGAGETQTPFGVWVSPCVLCILAADFVSNPYSVLINFPKASPRTCFFFVARLPVRCFSGFLSWFWLVSPGVGLVGLWFGCLLWSVMVLRLLPC